MNFNGIKRTFNGKSFLLYFLGKNSFETHHKEQRVNLKFGVPRRELLQNGMIQVVERVDADADDGEQRTAKGKRQEIAVDDP
jgi:hypothetical protein